MVVVDGLAQRHRGVGTRTVRKQGKDYLSMPRKESSISIPVDIKPMSMYKVAINAFSNSGNGAILVEFVGTGYSSKPFQTYVKSKTPQQYIFDIPVDAVTGDMALKLSRPRSASGNILIEAISYEEIGRPESEAEKEAQRKEKELQALINKQKQAAKEAKMLRERRLEQHEEDRDAILIAKGEKMGTPVKIGGKSYRWRGKNIRTDTKFGAICAFMSSRASLLMVPCKIVSEARYRIKVTAARVDGSGNGTTMVNLFGGQKYDGTHAKINISSGRPQTYTVEVKAPKFPANFAMNLRLWRPSNGSGTVCIKEIEYVQIEDEKPEVKQRAPKLNKIQPLKPKSKSPRKRPTIVRPQSKTPKEDYDMKFKPYSLDAGREAVEKVLITNADQVPKVSIITPTRDGKELLAKCYEALNKNTSYPNWEWIIGDSESEDGTAEYIRELKDTRIKFIERGTTEGSFSSINNELTEYADGEYYLFLNNDTEPAPFWLYEMVSKIHRHPDIGVVGARLEYENGTIQHSGVAFIPQGPANIGKDSLSRFGPYYVEQDRFYQAVTGACMLMRKEDFEAVDGFDTIYYFCYEDVDLCLKVRDKLKKKVLYAANARVKHLESVTQKRHKTSGDRQRAGIDVFKKRWMSRVERDFARYIHDPNRNMYEVDVSFVTCVNNMTQYRNYVVGSLLMNKTQRNYEVIPIMNFGNPYSAAQALNLGISQARGKVIVLCHQDVIFYENWIDMLFERIKEIERDCAHWGVLGTAGITTKDVTIGVVHNLRGNLQWQSTRKNTVFPVQTVDEHCMVIRKNSNLRFDEAKFDGFHFYGPDLCLTAMDRGMRNYGILCPLVHDSNSGSLVSGKKEFMRLLNALSDKWRKKFPTIRTATSLVKKKKVRTFVKFKSA